MARLRKPLITAGGAQKRYEHVMHEKDDLYKEIGRIVVQQMDESKTLSAQKYLSDHLKRTAYNLGVLKRGMESLKLTDERYQTILRARYEIKSMEKQIRKKNWLEALLERYEKLKKD